VATGAIGQRKSLTSNPMKASDHSGRVDHCCESTQRVDRRTFLARAAAALVIAPELTRVARPRREPALSIGILSPSEVTDRYRGALLGVEEAEHAAKLFGGSVQLARRNDPGDRRALSAIIGDGSLEHMRVLARRATAKELVVMNSECTADELRGEGCADFLFHVAPSDAMVRQARALAHGAEQVVAWDGGLVRFGADTLNDRFRQRFGVSMTPAAWGAWFAVKALWESSLRLKNTTPAALVEYLSRDTTQFDGHKGKPLSFRSWDHQLRQFLYARVGSKLVDVPEDPSGAPSARIVMDRLGASASSTSCHIGQ
jgi:hypothetical protein